ncbi:MAG TPA: class I SAM-dependent methyltransferase [Gammaproteobacteria bacterium]|nr:class I SAM-dependent methyltransferase [Gammaproteobacteria bacterium]
MTDFVKEFWERQGEKYQDSHWASWGDHYMMDLEIDFISKMIQPNNRVLDAGCANGFSAFKQYEKNDSINIVGIDYSQNMIQHAKAVQQSNYKNCPIDFKVQNILELDFPDNHFDIAYTTRVLINLSNWTQQQQAISELWRVVKPGGKLILLEGFWEPLVLLNSLRALKDLQPLVEHDFNRYLKKNKLEAFLKEQRIHFQNHDYSSVYYLGSRFLRELLTNPADYEGYSNPINKLFYEIEKDFSGGGFGIQQAYSLSVVK